MVWWLSVELEIARVLLERLQRLACLAITGALNTTPAMEILVGLVPLDIHIKQVAMTTCYRTISTNNWEKYGTSESHTCIQDEMQQNIPVACMCRDYMIPHFSFEKQFAVDIPEKEHWLDDDHHPIPPSSQIVYTDGSGVCRERVRASALMDSQVIYIFH